MSLVNNSKKTYNSSIAILTAASMILGFGAVLFGFLFVPFAAAFYAMLLMCESHGNRRILSYVVPALVIASDVLFNGFLIFPSLSLVLVGFLMFFMYKRRVGKLETVFILSGILFTAFVANLFIITSVTVPELKSVRDIISYLYESGKGSAPDLYNDITLQYSKFFHTAPNFTFEEFSQYYSLIYSGYALNVPPVLFAVSIASVGITSKMFRFFVARFTKDAPNAMKWRLHTPTLFAIVYIASSILSLFAGAGIFGICIRWIYIIFSIVYAYIGVRFVYQFISLKKNSFLAVIVIALSFILLSTFAYQLASYFGAYYVISVNRRADANRQS